jgi:hypothetical protein
MEKAEKTEKTEKTVANQWPHEDVELLLKSLVLADAAIAVRRET